MQREAVWQELADLTRREFVSRALTVSGWGAYATVLGAGVFKTVSFFFPRVRFEPPSTFRIGTPSAFLAGADTADAYGVVLVDDRWKAKERFIVVRERDLIYALFARCTHLGCTINWFADARTFKCPCHGSQYHSNGTNFAGPAPRPLDRLRIDLAVDGQLVVDTSAVYGPDRFGVDGAFVRL